MVITVTGDAIRRDTLGDERTVVDEAHLATTLYPLPSSVFACLQRLTLRSSQDFNSKLCLDRPIRNTSSVGRSAV